MKIIIYLLLATWAWTILCVWASCRASGNFDRRFLCGGTSLTGSRRTPYNSVSRGLSFGSTASGGKHHHTLNPRRPSTPAAGRNFARLFTINQGLK